MKVTHFLFFWLTLGSLLFAGCSQEQPREEYIGKKEREEKPKIVKTSITGAEKDQIQASLSSKPFKYTSRAACQIKQCCKLTLDEVKTIVAKGKLVRYDAKNEDLSCPLYAIEHTLPGKGKALILTAACPESTKIVRVVMTGVQCPNCK